MNFRTTLILLCVLIAVGIIVVLTQHRDLTTTEEVAKPTGEKLFTISSADLTKISFTDDAGQPIVLEKSGFKWWLTAPVKGPADDSAVTTLISAVTDAEARGKVDAGPATGLDSPTHKVELTTKQNATVAFDVGNKSATGEVVYVRRQGQSQADVVSATFADAFDKPLKEWRRAKLLDVGATEIKQLHVASTQPTVDLQKQGTDWQMMQPTTEPVDAIAVSDLTSTAANLRAQEFVSDTDTDAGKYGLDQPVMTVQFDTAGAVLPPATAPSTQAAPVTIKFGRFGDVLKKDVYAQVSTQPGIFKVPATVLTSFQKSPLDLRDKKVVSIDPSSVTQIEITKNEAATTQPTTRPASSKSTMLQIRQNEANSTTKPATSISQNEPKVSATTMAENSRNEPTTAATSGPATTSAASRPSTAPTSKWMLTGNTSEEIDNAKIQTLLSNFHPLRAERYEGATGEPAVNTYTLTLHMNDRSEVFTFIDSGAAKPLRGEYGGLRFVVSRELIDAFDTDFAKSAAKPISTPPSMPPEMP